MMKKEISDLHHKQLQTKPVATNKKFLRFKIKSKTFDTKDQIFKIVLSGLLLAIAVGTSLIEVRIPIMGALVPLRIFDVLIIMLAIPIIGIWYNLAIAIIEPWLHLALDGDHPPIQMVFDDIANIVLVVSFVLIFYKLFKFQYQDNQTNNIKMLLVKRSFAGLILVPLNAIVSTACFILTLVVLSNTNLSKPDEYIDNITAFYHSAAAIFFILLAIELGRFVLVYILFAVVQKKLGQLNRFKNN